MNHKFKKTDFKDAESQVEELCQNCGEKRIRYASGSVAYFNERGGKTPHASKCGEYKKQIEYPPMEGTKQMKEEVLIAVKEVPVIFPNKLNNSDARLVEALVTIRLLYEDMVKADFYCKSRNIAGRFLYSQGYEQWVNELQRKTTHKEV